MGSSSHISAPRAVFSAVRSALHKQKVARTTHQLLANFGDTAWLEAGRRQIKARTPAQIELWRDVAAEIVAKANAAHSADNAKADNAKKAPAPP